MKKIKSILCLTAFLCLFPASSAFALETSSQKIPGYMTPGTVIHYDENKNMTILKEGDTNSIINDQGFTLDSSELPDAEPDMTVIYDSLGGPVIQYNSAADNDDSNSNDYEYSSIVPYINYVYDICGGPIINNPANTK